MKMNSIFQKITGSLFAVALAAGSLFGVACSEDSVDVGEKYFNITNYTAGALVTNATVSGFEFKAITNASEPFYANTIELIKYEIRSNTDWTIEIDGDGAEWLSVLPLEGGSGDGFIRIGAYNNDVTTARATTVNFILADGTYADAMLTVRQMANDPYLTVTLDGAAATEVKAERAAQSHALEVSSNIDYFYATKGGDWFHLTENAYGQFTLDIEEWPAAGMGETMRREGEIVLQGAGEYKDMALTIPIVQSVEPRLTITGINNNTITFAGTNPSGANFTINSNYDWEITIDIEEPWFTINPMSGKADETVAVTVSTTTNPGDPRTGSFTIAASTISQKINVNQGASTGEEPIWNLDKPVIWAFDAEFYNNKTFASFEENGTMQAYEGIGTLEYVQGNVYPSEGGYPTCQIGTTGHPYVNGFMPGDSWVFTVPVKNLPAGGKVRFTSYTRVSAQGLRYFLAEYKVNGAWKPALEVKTADVSGTPVEYNVDYKPANTDQTLDITMEFEDGIADGSIELRVTCQSNIKAASDTFIEARGSATHRWSGNYKTYRDEDGLPTCPVFRVVY